LKINDKEGQHNQQTEDSVVDSIPTTGEEFIQAVADLEAKQDNFDHQQEMEEADEDAETIVQEAEDD